MAQYNLPKQISIQQSAARPLSGEELETYGKHAAAKYLCGSCTLHDAVVETVKSAGLSPEQVKRVVEFANTDAFIREFKKEGAHNKYVVFDGGPADFSDVLKDLNDGGGGSVFDRGLADYAHSPTVVKTSAVRSSPRNGQGMEKAAHAVVFSSEADDVLAEAFKIEEYAEKLAYARPLEDVEDLRDKLASARDAATYELSMLEGTLLDVSEEMYQHVKQAALAGVPLGHVVHAWHAVLSPAPELVKAAFAEIGPRLVEEGVVDGWDALGSSLEKTAGVRVVANEASSIVRSFAAYGDTLNKLAEVRATRDECMSGLEQLRSFSRQVHQYYPEYVR